MSAYMSPSREPRFPSLPHTRPPSDPGLIPEIAELVAEVRADTASQTQIQMDDPVAGSQCRCRFYSANTRPAVEFAFLDEDRAFDQCWRARGVSGLCTERS